MSDERVLGIDVSRWQDNNSTPQQIDFAKARQAGAQFVFIKASQACWLDEDFVWNWKAAKDAGLWRGAYHYLDWTRPALDQARFFAGVLEKDPGEFPPVLDYECRTNIPRPGTARLACKTFLEELTRLIWHPPLALPGLYTGPSYWKEFGSADQYWSKYWLWIANYYKQAPDVPKPWTSWTFWQYTDIGDGLAFGAESKELDMNWFNGGLQALQRFAGISVPEPSVEEPSFANYRVITELHLEAGKPPQLVETRIEHAA